MSQSPPSTLGKYQIIREIARSNDIVYEAYDPLMNRRVALKELALPGGSTPQQREDRVNRFKREAQAAGTLNHPNIMTVYEMGSEGDRLFMALEYLDGHTLRNEIDTKGTLPVDRAVEIALAVLRGLEHAHGKGVVHRDIKPDNIQLLSNGEVKITDFGIARLTFQPNLTMDGQVFGTPSYMSPEQVVGREIDQRSDLFSVGVMLYEMLSGRKPFPGDSVVTITYAIMNKAPEPMANCPHAVWPILEKAMDKSPQLRFSNAVAMIQALEEAKRSMTGPVMAPTPPPTANPYAAGNPYAPTQAPPPVIQTPYGSVPPPVVASPPPVLPGQVSQQPYGQAPAPNPLTYAYNPYQPHPQAGGQPPYVPTPIFYPPPPRQPLLKPEQKQFMAKVFLAVIIVGSLIALLIAGINSLVAALNQSQRDRQDQARLQNIPVPAQAPINQQIELRQQRIDAAEGARREDEMLELSQLKDRAGRQAMRDRDFIGAEKSFQESIEAMRNNPGPYEGLGQLYARRAADADGPMQLDFLRLSAEHYAQAYEVTPILRREDSLRIASARASLNLAQALLRAQGSDPRLLPLRSEAREALLGARSRAPEGSPEAREAERLLRLLTGG